MNWELVLCGVGLAITVGVNIVAVAYFAGTISASQKFMEKSIAELKESFKEKTKEIKDGFNEKVKEIKDDFKSQTTELNDHTEKHIKRLEEKQDKYNNIQERTALNESSLKSAHHRLDEIKEDIKQFQKD